MISSRVSRIYHGLVEISFQSLCLFKVRRWWNGWKTKSFISLDLFLAFFLSFFCFISLFLFAAIFSCSLILFSFSCFVNVSFLTEYASRYEISKTMIFKLSVCFVNIGRKCFNEKTKNKQNKTRQTDR